MNRITFSHYYRKLNDDVFTTIRRYDRYRVGEEYEIHIKDQEHPNFTAMLMDKYGKQYKDIPLPLLQYDTDMGSREMATQLFNTFYRKPIQPTEEMTILILRNVEA